MPAKQTGPDQTVKGLTGQQNIGRAVVALSFSCLLALSACSGGGWVNAAKSPAEVRADEAICDKESEEDALSRAGRQRADYGAPPSGPTPGGYGQSPMQMRDRDVTTKDFRSSYDRCMESKGYTKGTPGKR